MTSSGWLSSDGDDDDWLGRCKARQREIPIAELLNQRDAEARAKANEMAQRAAAAHMPHIRESMRKSVPLPNRSPTTPNAGEQAEEGNYELLMWSMGLIEHSDAIQALLPGSRDLNALKV
jgi:hypothetical protein